MSKQIPIDDRALVNDHEEHGLHVIAPDLAYRRLAIVNVMLAGNPGGKWVLVDAGVPGMADRIRDSARERFGASVPQAIILTHGHFDHVGALRDLAEEWNVPIYAHEAELPY